MINLENFSFEKLLIDTLIFTQQDMAMASAMTAILKRVYAEMKKVDFTKTIPDELLDIVAVAEKVDLYDSSLPIAKKRALVQNSEMLKRKKGTRGAIELAIATLFDDGKIYEWWEYDGLPYHFYVEIFLPESGLNEKEAILLSRLINLYKNERSQLDSIKFYAQTTSNVYPTAIMQAGETLTVYPWMPEQIELNTSQSLGSVAHTIENLTLYPKGEE